MSETQVDWIKRAAKACRAEIQNSLESYQVLYPAWATIDDRLASIIAEQIPVKINVHTTLSPKKRFIIECIGKGMKNREIAVLYGTTEQVIKNQLRFIFDMFKVTNRVELATLYINVLKHKWEEENSKT